VLLVLPLSWFFGRFRMMTSLVLGMFVATVGFTCSGLSTAGAWAALMIFVFAIGEIICSPKFSEYIGMSAPPDKKAIYMGYSNIPFAIGWAVGNWASGPLYDLFSSRTALARRWLVEQGGMTEEATRALPDGDVLGVMVQRLGTGADSYAATRVLWDAYDPWVIWVLLGTVGALSLVGMIWTYTRSLKRVA